MRPEQQQILAANAERHGLERERRPAERIVITGFAQQTPLGGTWETWDGLVEGRSGVVPFDVENHHVSIAAPHKFNPLDHFPAKRMERDMTPIKAMAVVTAREAAQMAGLTDEKGKLHSDFNRKRFGSWIGTGIGSTQFLVDVYKAINEEKTDNDGNKYIDRRANTRRGIPVLSGLRVFPEEINAAVTMDLGIAGWGGSSTEACATGLSNIVEAVRTVREGYNDIAIGGGFEDPLSDYPELAIGLFAPMTVLSTKRNNDPERASRPFDKARDGFVAASGGGVMVVESLDHALARGANILAEITGFAKAMDGFDPTALDEERVAQMLFSTIWNEKLQQFRDVDAIFAHATSTEVGDIKEARVLRRVFGSMLEEILITAIKSNMGHLEGGAGAANAIAATQAVMTETVPPIINLDDPDDSIQELRDIDGEIFDTFRIADLNLVRGRAIKKPLQSALAVGYGFGGHDAGLLISRWND